MLFRPAAPVRNPTVPPDAEVTRPAPLSRWPLGRERLTHARLRGGTTTLDGPQLGDATHVRQQSLGDFHSAVLALVVFQNRHDGAADCQA